MDNIELDFAKWMADETHQQTEQPASNTANLDIWTKDGKFFPTPGKVFPNLLRKIQTNEVGGATAAVFDPKKKSRDWNWEGAPGSIGVSPKEGPIMKKKSKK